MKYNDSITHILALASSAGLTAYYDDKDQCVLVEMDWGDDGSMEMVPIYEVSTMMDLVGN